MTQNQTQSINNIKRDNNTPLIIENNNNTPNNDVLARIGNTSNIRARRWCITINNYTDIIYDTITQYVLKKNIDVYIIGKEEGKENNTPHLQIYFETKNPITFSSIKKIFPTAHIEKAKGTREDNFIYCSKEKNFISNIIEEKTLEEMIIEEEYKDITWKDWQQNIINILNEKPNKRNIYWLWEDNGNVGKSFLCKYIALKNKAIICTGKTNDIFNQVLQWRNENPKTLQIPPIIIDNPRSEYCHINYSAIEQLKNGFIYCGKYEGGKVFGLSPHVFIFANNEPEEGKLSEDRLIITHIN